MAVFSPSDDSGLATLPRAARKGWVKVRPESVNVAPITILTTTVGVAITRLTLILGELFDVAAGDLGAEPVRCEPIVLVDAHGAAVDSETSIEGGLPCIVGPV